MMKEIFCDFEGIFTSMAVLENTRLSEGKARVYCRIMVIKLE